MGEEAEYLIEQMLDYAELWFGYNRHADREELRRTARVCERCGTEGLFFRELEDGKWRLHDASNNLHTCPRKDISNVSSFLSLLK